MVVCDASVIVKQLVEEADSDLAGALLSSTAVTAPELILAEAGNALWSRVRRGDMDVELAAEQIDKLTGLDIDLQSLRPLLSRALALANSLDHPIYDCFYLALAELG